MNSISMIHDRQRRKEALWGQGGQSCLLRELEPSWPQIGPLFPLQSRHSEASTNRALPASPLPIQTHSPQCSRVICSKFKTALFCSKPFNSTMKVLHYLSMAIFLPLSASLSLTPMAHATLIFRFLKQNESLLLHGLYKTILFIWNPLAPTLFDFWISAEMSFLHYLPNCFYFCLPH